MKTIERDFTRAEMEELDLPYNAVEEWAVDKRRWETVTDFVFEYEGKFWQATYADPATEYQEGQDIWWDDSCIPAMQVEKQKVVIEKWMPVHA